MSKNQWLKVTNIVLFISLALQAFTSLFFFMDSGGELIAGIHKYNGIVFLCLVALHVFLNWSWVKAVLFKK